jgi:ribosomal protein S21
MGVYVKVDKDGDIESALTEFKRRMSREYRRSWNKRRYGWYESPSALRSKRRKMHDVLAYKRPNTYNGMQQQFARTGKRMSIGY